MPSPYSGPMGEGVGLMTDTRLVLFPSHRLLTPRVLHDIKISYDGESPQLDRSLLACVRVSYPHLSADAVESPWKWLGSPEHSWALMMKIPESRSLGERSRAL